MSADDMLFLGVDLGAGGLKATLVDAAGRVRGTGSADVSTATPHPGWSEQDPALWTRAMIDAVPRAIAEAGGRPERIAAISFSAGAHSSVLVGANGEVLRPAILWNDQRSGVESRELDESQGGEILAVGGNRVSPTWTLPQLAWVARHEPDLHRRIRRIYVAKDWLRAQLTGDWTTDRTDAVGTLFFDIERDAWSPFLCGLAGISVDQLPPVVEPSARVGATAGPVASACGLPDGIAVICGTSDTSVEAFGGGAGGAGEATVKLATAATVSVVAARGGRSRTLINYPYVVPGLWYTITGTNSCASAHKWLRDRFFARPGESGHTAFERMETAAAATKPGSEGLLFHPYLTGERAPHWDPLLRADFLGITMRHQPGHFVRSLYEGIAFSLRDCRDLFAGEGLPIGSARLVGGGTKSLLWRQIVADVLGIEIRVPENNEASYGAALLAAVGSGAVADFSAVRRGDAGAEAVIRPDPARAALYDDLFGLYRQSQAAMAGIYHAIPAILARYEAAR